MEGDQTSAMGGGDAMGSGAGAIASGIEMVGNWITSAQNVHEVRQNRRFQRDMSNTAHQREMADLQKAGLNPILAVTKGGASTPSGSVGHIESPTKDFGQTVAKTQPLQARLIQAQINDINSAKSLKDEQRADLTDTRKARIDHMLAQATAAIESGELSVVEQKRVKEQIENLIAERRLINTKEVGEYFANTHSAAGLSKAKADESFYEGTGGKIAPWLEHVIGRLQLPSFLGIFRGKKSGTKHKQTHKWDSKGNWSKEESSEGGD